MVITLTRTMTNKSYTMGVLTFEGYKLRLPTQEKSIPKDRKRYVKKCLPAGEYKVRVEYGAFEVNDTMVHLPWFEIEKVDWFPYASFQTQWNSIYLKPGQIRIGVEQIDEFYIEQDISILKRVARIAHKLIDPVSGDQKEDVTLVIQEAEDMVVTDNDIEEQLSQQQAEKEIADRKSLEQDLLFGEDGEEIFYDDDEDDELQEYEVT